MERKLTKALAGNYTAERDYQMALTMPYLGTQHSDDMKTPPSPEELEDILTQQKKHRDKMFETFARIKETEQDLNEFDER